MRTYLLDHGTSISACSQFVYSDEKYNEIQALTISSYWSYNLRFTVRFHKTCAQLAQVSAQLTATIQLRVFLDLNPWSSRKWRDYHTRMILREHLNVLLTLGHLCWRASCCCRGTLLSSDGSGPSSVAGSGPRRWVCLGWSLERSGTEGPCQGFWDEQRKEGTELVKWNHVSV